MRARLNATGLALADTDWHIHELYAGLLPGATTVRATFHRYVIDANRGPDDASLYPGRNTTGLCPVTDFDGLPIWNEGAEPTEADIAERMAAFHAPYHAALAAQIERVRARHGVAILYDCHSIRSEIPFLFEGTLPDLNVGTERRGELRAGGGGERAGRMPGGGRAIRYVANGRFKGGWTTRHYGRPEEGVHAVQMELAQATYMEEAPPWAYATGAGGAAAGASAGHPRELWPSWRRRWERDRCLIRAGTSVTSIRRPGRRSPPRAG